MRWVVCVLSFLLFWASLGSVGFAQQRDIVLVIDPGHGGRDIGRKSSSSQYRHEKDIALSIALQLGYYINDHMPNVRVMYTRTEDVYVSLENRVKLANDNKADYFISIHCNAHPNATVAGTRTYIHSHQLIASRKLALLIEEDFATRARRTSRGVHDAVQAGHNLYVVRYTKMPSVLVETGFLTNPQEEQYLNTKQGQAHIASAIFRAFRRFLEEQAQNPVEDNRNAVPDNPLGSAQSNPVTQQTTAVNSTQGGQFRVQVMASIHKVFPANQTQKQYPQHNLTIQEEFISSDKFKYKYFAGQNYDWQGAQKVLKLVRELGYRDAFIKQIR
jgi:N-acetylmuramoyl-L-alanine amidase